MKVGIYYFSGTGNTKIISETVLKALSDPTITGHNEIYESSLIPIKSDTQLDINIYDTLGVLFPINAHATPPFMWKFLKNLPKVTNKPIFVIYTYNNSASIGKPLQNILTPKGYIIKGITGIKMPNHLITDMSMLANNTQRLEFGTEKTRLFIKNILAGQIIIDYKMTGSKFLSFFNRYTSIIWISMRLMTKLHTDETLCVNCMKCIDVCPVSNIQQKNQKLHHGKNCQFCMKCMKNCPTKAIHLNNKAISFVD